MKTINCPDCGSMINVTQRKKELKAVSPEDINLHGLESAITDIQEMRLRFEARFTATKQNEYGLYAKRLWDLEVGMKDRAEAEVKKIPIHEWIIMQKGLSYDIAGQIIGIVQDISRFENISKLWAYFGLAVIDVCDNCKKRHFPVEERTKRIAHIAERLKEQSEKKIVKEEVPEDMLFKATGMLCACEKPILRKTTQKARTGSLLDYNPDAKKLAYKIEGQFVKQGSLYRKLYDEFKAEYAAREDLKTEIESKSGKKVKGKNGEAATTSGTAHIDNMAKRKMVKIFLQHLWIEWRTLEKLPVSMPYVIDHLKHTKYIKPENTLMK